MAWELSLCCSCLGAFLVADFLAELDLAGEAEEALVPLLLLLFFFFFFLAGSVVAFGVETKRKALNYNML